jgi:hypothetical protein
MELLFSRQTIPRYISARSEPHEGNYEPYYVPPIKNSSICKRGHPTKASDDVLSTADYLLAENHYYLLLCIVSSC